MATIVENRLRISPETGTIGATVSGIDLADRLSDDLIAELEVLLVEHKVLFFRDQNLTRTQHLGLARRFGELEIHPLTTGSETFATDSTVDPEVIVIESDATKRIAADQWHSDVTWRETPSLGSLLRCLVAPAVGGDTLWVNMEAAYDSLDADAKARLEGLTATHDWLPFRRLLARIPGNEAHIARLEKEYPPQVHPVVRTHPDSGRKCVFVNSVFTVRINGLEDEESQALLRDLSQLAGRPDHAVRFRWTAGALAFWDNRSTQHYATGDFFPQHRLMERVTVAGRERPF